MKNKAAQQKALEVKLKREATQRERIFQTFLSYEIKGCWWSKYVPKFMHKIIGRYFGWKTLRKYKRFTK